MLCKGEWGRAHERRWPRRRGVRRGKGSLSASFRWRGGGSSALTPLAISSSRPHDAMHAYMPRQQTKVSLKYVRACRARACARCRDGLPSSMNSRNPCMFINLWSELCSAGCSAGGRRLPVPRNSRWHGCQQAPAARPRPSPWRKEAYKAYENGAAAAAAAEVHGRRRHVNVIRIMPGILIIPSAPLQPHFPTAVEFLQCQSRAGRKWA